MRKILFSVVFAIVFVVPIIAQAVISSRPSHSEAKQLMPRRDVGATFNPYVTRAQLIKILKKERPDSPILGTTLFGSRKKLLRPKDPVTLAEAAVFITNAFELEKPENPNLEWFEPTLIALESENAIPTSIFMIMEKLTRAEVLEIIDRLKNNITDRPSMTFQSLVHPRYIGSQWADFWRVSVPLANAKLLRLLKEPAYYQIFDVSAEDQTDNAYCQRYASETVTVVYAEENFEVTFSGKSADYCDEGKAKPYELRMPDSASDRIKIVRTKLEKLPYEWGSSGPFYEQTRVDTQGTLETKTLKNGETLFIYKTPWQIIFNDLRGTPFFMAAKQLSDRPSRLPTGQAGSEAKPASARREREASGSAGAELKKLTWMKFYEGPAHNRDFYGYGNLSYEKCISDPIESDRLSILFCIKKEGGNLVVASRLELGDRLTLWIDEHFKR